MKTQTQHTPGPWQTTDLGRDIGIVPTSQPLSRSIAVCSRLYREDAVDCEANARLIAAAPDLLAAAQQALSYLDDQPNSTPGSVAEVNQCAVRYGLRTAIYKATNP